MISYGKQSINDQDIDAVVNVLKSDFLTQGPCLQQFEECVSQYVGAEYGLAVNSATSALHIACMALGLSKGDWVWTTPISFVATSNAAIYCDADVEFVDVDANTFNMCANVLEKKLQYHKQHNLPLPKIVIPVHMAGQSCDMEAIHKLSIQYNFKIIEDASHGIGGEYQSKKVGCCQYSDITIFSFHPVKIITTAEGGMALTNSKDLKEKMGLYRSHGITRDVNNMQGASHGPWYYQQIELGYNYRMSDIHAALGLSQMSRLDEFMTDRNQLAENYYQGLNSKKIRLPEIIESVKSSWHLFIIQVDYQKRKEVFEGLRQAGIGANVHYIPIHTQPFYKDKYKNISCPVAEAYYQRCVSIPLYHGLSHDDQSFVIDTVNSLVS